MRKLAVSVSAALVLAAGPRLAGQSTTPPAGQPAQQIQGLPRAVPSNVIQKIIVKVNGEIFTQTELVQRHAEAVRQENQDPKDLKAFQDDAKLAAQIAEVTPAILVEAVDELLMVQRGREIGIRFTDAQFKDAIDRVKKQNNLDDEGLKKAMAQAGLTLEELRQNFERTYLMQGVTQTEIMQNMRLTEEETRQYYAKHPEAFMQPATLVLREIVVNIATQPDPTTGQPSINAAEADEAKERITKARARVLAGEDFVKVAAEVSEGGSKANGGLVGTVVVDEMVPALRDALNKLKPKEISEPIRVSTGYRIYMVESRAEAQVLPFDQVRETIAQKIYQERVGGEQRKYIEKLRAQAVIEWKDDNYRKQYEKALLERGKTGTP
jgi:parvulin-like peptidyl-prolyl isomerase